MLIYQNIIKPVFDRIASILLILILSPGLLIITWVLFIQNKKKPFFFQTRIGRGNREFKIIKFKTMLDTQDDQKRLLPDHQRITPLGSWLRKNSLDELPQLVNVLRGEMSFIGPRPLLPEYLPLYNKQQIRRHTLRPGLTGWAQVHGRNALSWSEKFDLDLWYLDHISFRIDWEITLKTLLKIFSKEAIKANSTTTMEKFTGN